MFRPLRGFHESSRSGVKKIAGIRLEWDRLGDRPRSTLESWATLPLRSPNRLRGREAQANYINGRVAGTDRGGWAQGKQVDSIVRPTVEIYQCLMKTFVADFAIEIASSLPCIQNWA